ncbi:MAG TPA: acyl-CoA dehydrogenase family protein [Acidimicrobiales bacterium]|nr:acyl-CoA dehydrogenase family protein [Acidimicrobiales bacterium]
MSTTTLTSRALLTDEMLSRFDERAPIYDRENRFFTEDFEELRASGYLLAQIPEDMGGSGVRLDEYLQLQQRLAYYAGPTALAVNMHCYWMGLAADLLRSGDDSCKWMLEKGAAGEIFAAIHGEAGNDIPAMLSTTSAERGDGGWIISGHKIFGSLSPVWTYGGFHAMDTSDPANPKIVHGFIPRNTPGVEIVETWDTLGMRATQSHDTVLERVFVPDELCPVVTGPGFAGATPFLLHIFAWALLGFASVYLGMARRAFDLTCARVPQRSSIALTRSMAYHPEVQHNVAEMRIALDAAQALLDRVSSDWAQGVEHPDWPIRIVGARYFVINQAFDVVDKAMDLSGGAASFKRNRLEQIFRDARMGKFHPGNSMLAHEVIGKLCLGIDPDDALRWG